MNPTAPITEIRGVVRSETGEPVAGVIVMGADLAWVETDAEGEYALKQPDMALFFWCTGYHPRTYILRRTDTSVDVVLRTVGIKTSLAVQGRDAR